MLGIGGGGDAVGSLAVSSALEERGVESVLGGVAWERFAVDPEPGPRPLGTVRGPIESGPGWALVDPATGARTPGGIQFCESHLAAHLGQPTVLIDVTEGPTVAARGIEAAAARLGCDAAALIDIGGDAIAAGGEPGLASPLCDAVMVAAGAELGLPAVLGVLGAGCDGELLPAEVLERVAALAGAGAWIGTHGVSPEAADAIDRAAEVAVTEASRMVARCARGEIGEAEIRGGRRTVELGPVGGLCFLFDMELAAAELPLVRAVRGSGSLEEANTALGNLGVSTELDYERGRAAAA